MSAMKIVSGDSTHTILYSRNPLGGGLRTLRVEHPLSVVEAGVKAWMWGGELIQNAMPFLTDGEREFLLTGFYEDEWEDMFSVVDDEEE